MILLSRIGQESLSINCFFNKHHPETIILPAPSLFNFVGPYLVTWAAVQAYKNPVPAPEPEPQEEPPRQSVYSWDPEMAVSQWQSESSSSQYDPNYSSSQYDPSYTYGYPLGYPWQ